MFKSIKYVDNDTCNSFQFTKSCNIKEEYSTHKYCSSCILAFFVLLIGVVTVDAGGYYLSTSVKLR